ncbi:MAG: hypothetical protein U0167_10605 [bacterium]
MTTARNLRILLGLGAALASAACGHDDGPTAPPHFTEPAALVGGYATAFTARNAGACVDLLEAASGTSGGFRFFPKSEDLPALDWLAGDSWGYEREGGILSNMLDRTYVSEAAAAAGFTGVGTLTLETDSTTPLAGHEYDVLASGTFAMKRAALADVLYPVGLRFVLATSTDGTLVIREMHELSMGMDRSPGALSWGTVQSWYREPPPRYTDPTALIAAHAAALTDRDLEDYASLLDGSFQYFPQPQDLSDLPWMTGSSWGRSDELEMIRHMFDPSYEPMGSHAGSIDSIHATFQVLHVQPDSILGGTQVSTSAVLQVMYDASSGAAANVRFDFHLVSHDGHLLISEIRELPLHAPARDELPVEPQTWANIKALYRE